MATHCTLGKMAFQPQFRYRLEAMVRQRVLAEALGHGDVNDHVRLLVEIASQMERSRRNSIAMQINAVANRGANLALTLPLATRSVMAQVGLLAKALTSLPTPSRSFGILTGLKGCTI